MSLRLVLGVAAIWTVSACEPGSPDTRPGGTETAAGIGARSECRAQACEIRMSHVAAFSDSGAEGQLPTMAAAMPDSRRRLIVAGINRILVYDSAGRLADSFGRRGRGPGEFVRLVSVVVGPGDSIYAFDIASWRLSVISPDMRFVRAVPFRYMPRFVLGDGSFLVAMQIPTPGSVNYPLHRVLADGSVANSFGGNGLPYPRDVSLQIDRAVGPGRDGSVWAVPLGRYSLERYDPVSGAKLDSVRVVSPWFKESDSFGDDLRERPNPILEGVWEDTLGFVWVLGREADRDWKPATTDPNSDGPSDRDATYDWVLEVVDPDDARVVASTRIPTYPRIRHPARSLLTLGPDSTEVTHHVWRLSIARKPQS